MAIDTYTVCYNTDTFHSSTYYQSQVQLLTTPRRIPAKTVAKPNITKEAHTGNP